MSDLRPIGTVFAHVCPARATYRVAAHVERNDGFGNIQMMEELECLSMEELPAPEFIPLSALKSWHHYRAWQLDYAESFELANK